MGRHSRFQFVGLCVVGLVTSLGCNREEKATPPATAAPAAAAPASVAPAKAAPKYALAGTAFAEEFKKAPKDVLAKYAGGSIELDGAVSNIQQYNAKESFIEIGEPNKSGTKCWFAQKEPWGTVALGQRVKVRGVTHTDSLLDPSLYDCEVVESGPGGPVTISAEELADAFAKDKGAALKKYEKKRWIVTGEIAAKTVGESKAVTLTLKAPGATPVRCAFSFLEEDQTAVAPLTVGQKVKVWGELAYENYADEQLKFGGCKLVTK